MLPGLYFTAALLKVATAGTATFRLSIPNSGLCDTDTGYGTGTCQ